MTGSVDPLDQIPRGMRSLYSPFKPVQLFVQFFWGFVRFGARFELQQLMPSTGKPMKHPPITGGRCGKLGYLACIGSYTLATSNTCQNLLSLRSMEGTSPPRNKMRTFCVDTKATLSRSFNLVALLVQHDPAKAWFVFSLSKCLALVDLTHSLTPIFEASGHPSTASRLANHSEYSVSQCHPMKVWWPFRCR